MDTPIVKIDPMNQIAVNRYSLQIITYVCVPFFLLSSNLSNKWISLFIGKMYS